MLVAPVEIAAPADFKPSDCLATSGQQKGADARIDALIAEAKVWPIRVLEPDDSFLPATMPDRFKPQVVVMDARLDPDGRATECDVRRRSAFAALDSASCELIRAHYVATSPAPTGKITTAVIWTSRSPASDRRGCTTNGGAIPVTSSLWVVRDVFKGAGLQSGTVLIGLDVGTKGFADRCVVLAADVTPDLQRNVCRMAVQRATIMPAADKDGKLVPSRLTIAVRLHK